MPRLRSTASFRGRVEEPRLDLASSEGRTKDCLALAFRLPSGLFCCCVIVTYGSLGKGLGGTRLVDLHGLEGGLIDSDPLHIVLYATILNSLWLSNTLVLSMISLRWDRVCFPMYALPPVIVILLCCPVASALW